ncbi:MAG: helix-turn-helix domain-containing protein [Deferribacterales bacterium]
MIRKQDKGLNAIGFVMTEPCEQLKGFIQCYWFIKTDERLREPMINKIISDGGSGFVLNFGTPFIIYSGEETCLVKGKTVFTGVTDQTVLLKLKHRVDAVGIRFFPGVSSLILDDFLKENINSIGAVDDSVIQGLSTVYDEILNAVGFDEKTKLLDSFLMNVFREHLTAEKAWILRVIDHINDCGGNESVEDIASKFALSRRQFSRKFKQEAGLTPKQYLRIARIAKARSLMRDKDEVSLTTVGYECEYYDQAHFIKEFKDVVNLTPKEYHSDKKMSRLYNQEK